MSANYWVETLAEAQGDGPTLASSSSATSILPTAARILLPPGFFRNIGKSLRITAAGRLSVLNPTPGNLTLDVRMGGSGTIVVFNGGAMALNTAAAKTNVTWTVEMLLTCRAVGSGTSANILGTGVMQSEAINGAAAGFISSVSIPASAPAAGTGFDSTIANVLDLFATFSISNAANSLTLHQYFAEALN